MQTKQSKKTELNNKTIVAFVLTVAAGLLPAAAQRSDEREKSNELGLVIGATVTQPNTGERYFGLRGVARLLDFSFPNWLEQWQV
jgi:hypothetical protein